MTARSKLLLASLALAGLLVVLPTLPATATKVVLNRSRRQIQAAGTRKGRRSRVPSQRPKRPAR